MPVLTNYSNEHTSHQVSDEHQCENNRIKTHSVSLIDAIKNSNYEKIDSLIPFDISQEYSSGCSCGCSFKDSVLESLERGTANVEIFDYLMRRRVVSQEQAVKCLIKNMNNSGCNGWDNCKQLALHLIETLPQDLLINYVDVDNFGLKSYHNTMLMMATQGHSMDYVDFCNKLLDIGCDPFKKSLQYYNDELVTSGCTLFEQLVCMGNYQLVKKIVEMYPNESIKYVNEYEKKFIDIEYDDRLYSNMISGILFRMKHNVNREFNNWWTHCDLIDLYEKMKNIIKLLLELNIDLSENDSHEKNYIDYVNLYPREVGFHELLNVE